MATLTACGGGGSNSSKTPAAIVITPSTSASLNFGEVRAITAVVNDSSGNPVNSSTITWSSSNTGIATVTATGGKCGDALNSTNTTCVCAGKWDSNNIVCDTTGITSGTATLTATSGNLSSTITLFVHPRVARVVITTPPQDGGCTSSTGTLQATAQAFDSGNNPVTVGPDATAFAWSTTDSSIVTSDTKGLLTAVNPGVGNIFVSVSNVVSLPVPFSTCAVKKINVHVKDSTDTSFTADKGASKVLAADVIDSKDKTITIANSRLTWSSSNLGVASVDQSGNVTTGNAGRSAIVASCAAPTCNSGYNADVNSNVVTANVNGSTTPSVLVASTSSTSMFPIDSSGTVGTAITLPYNPNSLVYANTALGAYIGTDTALLAYDATKNAVATVTTVPGKVIAVSNNGSGVVIFDNSANTVTVLNNSGTSVALVDKFTVSGVPNPCSPTDQCPRASFTPNSQTAYIVAGDSLYVSTVNGTLRTFSLAQAAKDVAVTNQGSFAFVANEVASVDVWATCNASKQGSNAVATATVPQRIVSSTDGSKIYVATPPTIGIITPVTDATGCPPSLSDPLTTVDLGQGTFNTTQLLSPTRDNFIVMLTDAGNVVIYDVANNSGSAVTLSGGATILSGAITVDGALAYVGGSDKAVHKIDLTSKTDTPITVTVTPDLVAVRPQ